MNKTEQLFRTLPLEVQYDIEMQLYDEFNDLYCKTDIMIERDMLTNKELAQIKRAETYRKRELIKKYITGNC